MFPYPLPSSVCAQTTSAFGRCHDTEVHVAHVRRERMRTVDSVLFDEDSADQSMELRHPYRSHGQTEKPADLPVEEATKIRTGDQFEDGEGSRPPPPRNATGRRRRGDLISSAMTAQGQTATRHQTPRVTGLPRIADSEITAVVPCSRRAGGDRFLLPTPPTPTPSRSPSRRRSRG
jgi:hypothetical protein